MALSELLFDTTDYDAYLISKLADTPELSASDLKARFDYISQNVIIPRINEILANLTDASASDCGAVNIGCDPIIPAGESEPGSGANVYSNLCWLRDRIAQITTEAIEMQLPSGGLTDVTLSDSSLDIKARFAAHAASLGKHFIIGATTGTSTAYLFTSSDYAWDSIKGVECVFIIQPHVECLANATISICGSPAMTITPCYGGGLNAAQMRSGGLYILFWRPSSNALFIMNPEMRSHTHTDIPIANVANLTEQLNGKISTSASCNKAWNWSGQGGQPSWLWGGNDGTNMYVYNPSNFSVNYANSTNYANSAGSAGSAGSATNATNAVNADVWDGAHLIYSAATPSYVAGAIWLKPI